MPVQIHYPQFDTPRHGPFHASGQRSSLPRSTIHPLRAKRPVQSLRIRLGITKPIEKVVLSRVIEANSKRGETVGHAFQFPFRGQPHKPLSQMFERRALAMQPVRIRPPHRHINDIQSLRKSLAPGHSSCAA